MAREMARIALKLTLRNKASLGIFVKIEKLFANYRNIPNISFKLLDNYPINSQMFQFLFYYTSVLFMIIFQKQEKT